MVFEVTGTQQLSQKNAKTLKQRCTELIIRAACIDQIRSDVIKPVLEFYAHKATPSRTLGNDAVYLAWMLMRQGTMLCLLLNNFRTGILESFHLLKSPINNESIFTDDEAKANIKLFLAACRGDLYMTEEQLFTATTLYTDDTNTLSKAIALTDNFFARIGRIQALNYDKKFEQIRAEDSLFNIEEESKGNGEKLGKDSAPTDLRLYVIREMLDTEQGYIADLDKLQSYAEELRIDKVISVESWNGIFANLDALVDFQRRFMLQMEAKLTKTVLNDVQASYKAGIAKIFLDNEQGFSVYEEFCANQSRAENLITIEASTLMTKAKVMEPNVVLRAYLIKPLQRICKYPLLLRELIKQSAPDAPDRVDLEEAYRVCDKVTKRVNERKRDEENALAATELFSVVKEWRGIDKDKLGSLLLLHTGQLSIGSGEPSYKEMEFYLFANALLALGKSKSMADVLLGNRKVAKQQMIIKFNIAPSRMISAKEGKCPIDGSPVMVITFRRGISGGGAPTTDSATIKFRMVEQTKQWIMGLSLLMEAHRPREIEKPLTVQERRRQSLLGVPVGGMGAGAPLATLPKIMTETAGTTATAVTATSPATTDTLRLKIFWGDDVFVTACPDEIVTLIDLKRVTLKKLKDSLQILGQPHDRLTVENVSLKYYDEQKDLISLLDDTDVAAALLFNPNAISVRVMMPMDNWMMEVTRTSPPTQNSILMTNPNNEDGIERDLKRRPIRDSMISIASTVAYIPPTNDDTSAEKYLSPNGMVEEVANLDVKKTGHSVINNNQDSDNNITLPAVTEVAPAI